MTVKTIIRNIMLIMAVAFSPVVFAGAAQAAPSSSSLVAQNALSIDTLDGEAVDHVFVGGSNCDSRSVEASLDAKIDLTVSLQSSNDGGETFNAVASTGHGVVQILIDNQQVNIDQPASISVSAGQQVVLRELGSPAGMYRLVATVADDGATPSVDITFASLGAVNCSDIDYYSSELAPAA